MTDTSTYAGRRWPTLLAGLGALLVVVLPVLALQSLSGASQEAADRVAHTRHVEAIAATLAWNVREVESAALLGAAGADLPLTRQRMDQARREIPRTLSTLTALTADNPAQQVRLGRLAELIESRMELVERLLSSAPAERRRDATALVTRFAIRDLLLEVVSAEQALLARRTAESERRRDLLRVLGWGGVGVQVLLLGLIAWLLLRQAADRATAEARSRRDRARAHAVLQTVREPIVLLDDAQCIVLHNNAFAEMYGHTEDGALLHEVGDGAWDDAGVRQRLGDVLSRGRELWDYEYEQTTVDGQRRSVLLNARPMSLPDGEEDVALVTVSDVTAQKADQQRIIELNRQLEGKVEQVSDVNRELEAFSYSVSHDLRAPLRHVSGFADKLRRHLEDAADDKTRHYLEVIGTSAKRMSQLIDDLLIYSRLGRSALRLQAVDMQSMVAETRAMQDAAAEAEADRHRVDWRIAPLPIVVADENMMRQLWQNLLGNAVKYSARRERPVIEVTHERLADGSHQFSVRDNGAGFDMAYAGKLFGVFQRLHKASEYPGTGIGLASVRRVLNRHGGRIWAEAEPGQGATFHFILPAALDAPTHAERPSEQST